jgi:hypothetical protein
MGDYHRQRRRFYLLNLWHLHRVISIRIIKVIQILELELKIVLFNHLLKLLLQVIILTLIQILRVRMLLFYQNKDIKIKIV